MSVLKRTAAALLVAGAAAFGCGREPTASPNSDDRAATAPFVPPSPAAAVPPSPQAAADSGSVLVTKNYDVTITDEAPEGDVEHGGVVYRGRSRRTGRTLTLTGGTYNTHGPDGTPGHFLGYRFVNGNTDYQVIEIDGERARLQVVRNDREVLIDEVGEWHDAGASKR